MGKTRSPTLGVLSVFLVMVLLLTVFPTAAFAAEEPAESVPETECTEVLPEEIQVPAQETAEETPIPPEEGEEPEPPEDPYYEKYGITTEELIGWISGDYRSESEEPEDLYKVNESNPWGLDTPDGLTDAQWYEILADLMNGAQTMIAPTGIRMGAEFQIFSGRWCMKGYTSGGLGDYATVYYQGIAKTVKQYSFKYMKDSEGNYYAPYCIDPPRDFADSGYSATEFVNSDWWTQFGLTASQARAIILTLLYGSPNGFSTARDTAQYYAERAATQTIIWEILCQTSANGSYLRNSTAPYTRSSDALYKVFAKSTLYYNSGSPIASATDCSSAGGDLFANAYNTIASRLENHGVVPSFSSDRMGNAPVHKMTRNADGTYSITLTDTNNVLEKCR